VNSDQLTPMSFLRRAVALFPDREIVTRTPAGDVAISYRDFVARVHRLAHVLRDLGVRPGDRVATLAWNNQRHLELYFAVPCAGAVLHTVNLRLAAGQIAEIVGHAGDVIIFADEDKLDLAGEAVSGLERPPRIIVLADPADGSERTGQASYEELMAAASAEPYPFPELDERQAAATCYSSATTGRPKGVVYSHRSLWLHSMALGMADTWGLSEADTILPVVPMFHVNAWGLPFAAIWLGSRLILPGTAPSPEHLADLLAGQSVTFAAAVPTVWLSVLAVLSERGSRLPGARLFVSGGAPLPAALLAEADRAGLPLIHSYGMTEATPLVLVGRIRSTLASEPAAAGFARRLRQGVPVPGVEVAVIAEDGRPASTDGAEIGELWIRGPWVAEEYERDPRGGEVFVGGWYHTGDIVSVDSQGYLKVVDRKADLIKSGGEWISTVDLENALLEHPAVRLACVVGLPDERWSERPVAALVVHPGASDPADDELRDYLAAHFPKWWLPERFIRLDALPLTSVGKYDKKGLRSLLNGGRAVHPGTQGTS
jgi:fatty-acyl-CoA synthase